MLRRCADHRSNYRAAGNAKDIHMTDEHVEPLAAEPPPGWSNSSNTTPPVFYRTPGIDMSQPGFSNNGPAASGATAGIPGTWTPAGADTPNAFTSMDAITASPATAWTTGQYVVLGDGSLAHWGGAAWTSGKA
jgi:hypothetical protein